MALNKGSRCYASYQKGGNPKLSPSLEKIGNERVLEEGQIRGSFRRDAREARHRFLETLQAREGIPLKTTKTINGNRTTGFLAERGSYQSSKTIIAVKLAEMEGTGKALKLAPK